MIKIPFLGRGGENIQRISIEEKKNEIKKQIEKNVAEKDRPILYEIFGIIEQLTNNPHHQIELLSKLSSIVIIYGDGWELESFKKELLELQKRRKVLDRLKWTLIGALVGSFIRHILGLRYERERERERETTPTPSPSPTKTPTPSPTATSTPTPPPTPTPTPEATPTLQPTPTPEGFIPREQIKEWADGAVERIINEIERQNPGVRIEGVKFEVKELDPQGYIDYLYSIIWKGREKIEINKKELGNLFKEAYRFDMKYVYPGESGKGIVFYFKSLSPLIHSISIAGYWIEDYKGDEFSIEGFSVTKKTEEKKGRPVLYLELKVDPKNPKVNPPFSTTSTEKNLPPEK